MTWTYAGTPGTGSAATRRDAVRFYVGDTDTNDQQVTDEEITFALSQANDNVYRAAAEIARGLYGKYSRLVNTTYGKVSMAMGDRAKQYQTIVKEMERQAKIKGGLGLPVAGGISKDDILSVEQDTDRPDPAFKRGQFRNPPDSGTDDYSIDD